MDDAAQSDIHCWLVSQGLAGLAEVDLLRGFCMRCRSAGLELSRSIVFIDTLHPIFEGRGFRWRDDDPSEASTFEYGRTDEGEAAANWRRTPFYALIESGESELRIRLDRSAPRESTMVAELEEQGNTDYVAFVHRFASEAVIGDMECVYSHWATRKPDGFDEPDLLHLRTLVPALALAIKSAAFARIARTLVQVYLGRDPGERVLSGRISRGMADRIDAVLWFSDLRGYTAISDSADPAEIIPFLNDYAEAAITAIHDAGGDVLKLIGDGVLAIFDAQDKAAASRAALRAELQFREQIRALNERRAAEERPTTSAYVGLHVGEVFYGNIGSEDRLDFTVVGPAVNEVSRIASMCRSVDRDLLVSSRFRDVLEAAEREHLVSVGRFALRGVGRAEDLFTLDPAIRSDRKQARRYERLLRAPEKES